jgi:uncharacterized Fe-S cluster-containing radical SAM superfamily protein
MQSPIANKDYQRYLTPNSSPFDPLDLARKTEAIVCQGNRRKYTAFYSTGVYGGIATGYAVGCCLRCYYCWVDPSRDFPEKYGSFYSPTEVMRHLRMAAKRAGVKKLRISGAEPTIGKSHLLELLRLVEESEFRLFILETNGVLFGSDKEYTKKISRFKKVHVRVSLKAGIGEGFMKRTGAFPQSLSLPYKAIENLLEAGASFHVAAMTDPRIMSAKERGELIARLRKIDPLLVRNLEEEVVDLYETTIARLRCAGVRIW